VNRFYTSSLVLKHQGFRRSTTVLREVATARPRGEHAAWLAVNGLLPNASLQKAQYIGVFEQVSRGYVQMSFTACCRAFAASAAIALGSTWDDVFA